MNKSNLKIAISALTVLIASGPLSAFAQFNFDPLGAPVETNGTLGGQAGTSVSLAKNGYVLAVGSRYAHDCNAESSAGAQNGCTAVYDWDPDAGVWTLRGERISGGNYDEAGTSVSLSADGNRLAVGAPKADASTGSMGTDEGSARVFDWNENSLAWEQVGSTLFGEGEGDNAGWVVSLSGDGNTVLVSAPENEAANENNQGAGNVRVFFWNDSTSDWEQQGQTLAGVSIGDRFGWAAALSADGTHLIVGADGAGSSQGSASVYRLDTENNLWVQKGITLSGLSGDRFGTAVDIDKWGTRIVMSAPRFDDELNSLVDVGRVLMW